MSKHPIRFPVLVLTIALLAGCQCSAEVNARPNDGDAGGPVDAGDAGGPVDAGDAGSPVDAGDAGGPVDAGDAGGPVDAGDAGGTNDAGVDAASLEWDGAFSMTVEEYGNLSRSGEPVAIGVPLVRGSVTDPDMIRVHEHPTQNRLLSRWPDGSAQWVLLDFQEDLQALETRELQVLINNPRIVPAGGISVDTSPQSYTIDTGPLRVEIGRVILDNLIEWSQMSSYWSAGPELGFAHYLTLDDPEEEAKWRQLIIDNAANKRSMTELRTPVQDRKSESHNLQYGLKMLYYTHVFSP